MLRPEQILVVLSVSQKISILEHGSRSRIATKKSANCAASPGYDGKIDQAGKRCRRASSACEP